MIGRSVFKWCDTYACTPNLGLNENSQIWKTLALCWIASPAAKSFWQPLGLCGTRLLPGGSGTKSLLLLRSLFFPLNLLIPSVCFYSLFKNILKSFLSWKFSNIYKIEIIMWTLMYSSPCFNNSWKFYCVASFIPSKMSCNNLHLLVFYSLDVSFCVVPGLVCMTSRTQYRWWSVIFQCHIFLPFHTVHGILAARILDWVAISSSSGPHFVRSIHYDPSILGGPARHGS